MARRETAFPPFKIPAKRQRTAYQKIDTETKISEPAMPELNYKTSFTLSNMQDIISNRMLNDKIINAGQTLIKMRFPEAQGLQDVLLGSMLKFNVLTSEFVQVVHCGRFPHWITVSTIGAPADTVYVYDSLNEALPKDALPQICQIINCKSSYLKIVSKSIQVQTNGEDIGLFALASIVTLLNGENPSEINYDIKLMRKHFLTSVAKGYLDDFPTLNCSST